METNRLILRKYDATDLQDLYEYLSDPDVVKFEPHKPMTKEGTEENLAWRIRTDEMIAVDLKENHRMILIRLNWGMYSIKHIGERVMLMKVQLH